MKVRRSKRIRERKRYEEQDLMKITKSISSLTIKSKAPTFKSIAKGIRNGSYRKIIIMAGAGISVASGIPDFRSPKTGLYNNLKKYNLPYPEAIFDIQYFVEKPQPFFTLAKELYPGNFEPTPVHHFFRLLQDNNVLKRVYTQNIDTLERRAGVLPHKLVESHGSFANATCVNCSEEYDCEDIKKDVMKSKIPRCKYCKEGIIKPNITFFGEGLPEKFWWYESDFPKADLLIVLGTSLSVLPFGSLIEKVPKTCHRLLINNAEVAVNNSLGYKDPKLQGFKFNEKNNTRDAKKIGDCQKSILEFIQMCGWEKQYKKLLKKSKY
ncbi:nad-dependent protein deacetylase sirtuin-2 [Anaeramoeba flamelloides]|uniref:NAD-dependent protein deacetylase n=1 Tax=Anaeramoeba flamelloides TaxID=1746091 RepID=A0AAV7YLG9_9EUKA|nr:nad-dependent protein deacetylase sirtuin-2 [Anaeramoeba flamelloides]